MAGLTRLLSTTTIQPASGEGHADANRRIELTTSDVHHLLMDYSQVGLLFPKPCKEKYPSVNCLVEHLKASLSLTLDRLYPLAGRLIATEHGGDIKTTSFSILCSGAGVTFVHAEAAESAVADILDPAVVPMKTLANLFCLNSVSNHLAVGSNLPLLAVQITELADGVFVACSMSFCAADGTTFWNFINVWSELSYGDEDAISQQGAFHFGLKCLDFPVRVPFCRSEVLPERLVPSLALQRKMIHFSKEKVAELKAKANSAEPKSCSPEREISSLQALMAHLWVCITRSRALSGDDQVSYMIAVNLRSRLQPPLPPSYVGTAVRTVTATCSVSKLLHRGMGWAARLINKAISSQNAEETRKYFYDRAKNCPPPLRLAEIQPNTLLTGGSPHFDVYGDDFGWGKPLAVRNGPALSELEGRLSVFPGAVQGSVDFELTLLPETLLALAGDPEYIRFSS